MIRQLLTLPITGPMRAGWWVVEQIINSAEAELYDEDRLIEQLRDLHARADAGDLTEEQHAAAESVVLERLLEARARRSDATQERS